MQRCASLARVMWHSAVILSLPWCVLLDKSSHPLQVALYFFSDAVPCHAHTWTSRMSVFYLNVMFVFISIDSIYDISLPSTVVLSLLAPDNSRQMQILDRTGMLRALDLTADGLIKLYALVETGLINDLDIDVVKVSTCFNERIQHVFDRATGTLACSACQCWICEQVTHVYISVPCGCQH